MVHLDGDALAEAERRLNRSGWKSSNRKPSQVMFDSARYEYLLVTVERLDEEDFPGNASLEKAVVASGLPAEGMVYVTTVP